MADTESRRTGIELRTVETEEGLERREPIRAEAGPGGFGLGLYIARLIVEAHGGRVWADSEVGTGSKFGFALPPAEPSSAIAPPVSW